MNQSSGGGGEENSNGMGLTLECFFNKELESQTSCFFSPSRHKLGLCVHLEIAVVCDWFHATVYESVSTKNALTVCCGFFKIFYYSIFNNKFLIFNE